MRETEIHSGPPHEGMKEIDIKSLLRFLWQGKLIVALFTVVFSVAAAFYAINAQQWWSSKALITVPNAADLVTFSKAVKRYQPAFDVDQPNDLVKKDHQLDALISREEIFERFITVFNAPDNKKDYFEQSVILEELLGASIEELDDSNYRMVLREWMSKINASTDDLRSKNIVTLSSQSMDPKSSLQLLDEYVVFTNRKVTQELLNELHSILMIKHGELSQQLESRVEFGKKKLGIEIEKAQSSLRIAEAANIKRPIERYNQDRLFSIDMGSEAIAQEIKELGSIENLSLIDSDIALLDLRINLLNREVPEIKYISFFSYLEKATVPLSRDKPKRSLIVFLGAFFGGLLGLLVVILRFLFSENK